VWELVLLEFCPCVRDSSFRQTSQNDKERNEVSKVAPGGSHL